MTDTLTLDTLLANYREIEAQFADVVARFVAEPVTIARLYELMYAAGVEFRETSDLPYPGIPIFEDPAIRRGFIECRNAAGVTIKVLALIAGQLYELYGPTLAAYRSWPQPPAAEG